MNTEDRLTDPSTDPRHKHKRESEEQPPTTGYEDVERGEPETDEEYPTTGSVDVDKSTLNDDDYPTTGFEDVEEEE